MRPSGRSRGTPFSYVRAMALKSSTFHVERSTFSTRSTENAAQKNDLPRVLRIVRDLPVDGLQHRMGSPRIVTVRITSSGLRASMAANTASSLPPTSA